MAKTPRPSQSTSASEPKPSCFGERALRSARASALAEIGGHASPDDVMRASLRWLGLDIDMVSTDLERVPASGSLLVAANHPTGPMEGILLMALLRSVRQDVRVLVPEGVSIGWPAVEVHLLCRGIEVAEQWLRSGGCLLVFPSGRVASPRRWFGPACDSRWDSAIAAMQRSVGCATLPAWVGARQPWWFRAAGWFGEALRSRLQPSALLAQRSQRVAARIGHPIPASQLARFPDDDDRARYLRLRCEILERRRTERGFPSVEAPRKTMRAQQPILDPVAPDAIERDLAALPASAELLRHGSIRVLCARAEQIPSALREIGRLREVTFRGVGEGSGLSCDLDMFDAAYWHLFLWDESARAIVGAYRLGVVAELLQRGGAQSLYTTSLYRFDEPFLEHVRNGVELGRSFVQPAYQKGFLPLLLLWKGIAAFVVRDPRRRHLFGTVSISADHHATSVRLMVDHLRAHCFDERLAASVKPIRPWRSPRSEKHGPRWDADAIRDIKDVSAMVREIEVVRQGVPVLLEQYLKLAADVVGINVDAAFHTIDALVVVDLAKSPLHLLERYMGPDEAKALKARFASVEGEAIARA
jgi:putative hemolysin